MLHRPDRNWLPRSAVRPAALFAAVLGVAALGCDDSPDDGAAGSGTETASSTAGSARSERVRPSGTASLSGAEGEVAGLRLKAGRVQNTPYATNDLSNLIHLDYTSDSEEGEGPKRLSIWIQLPKAGLSEGQEIDASQIKPDVHTYDALNYDAESGPRYNDDATGTLTITSLTDNRLAGKAAFTVENEQSGTDDDPAIQIELDFADIELPDAE